MRLAGLERQAAELYERLLKTDPHDVVAREGLATSLLMLGERCRAKSLIEEAFRCGEATPAMSVTLVRLLLDDRANEQAVSTAREHLKRPELLEGHRRRLLALLGKGLERLGQFDDAFAAYSRAAEHERRPFNRQAYREEIDQLIEFFTPEWFQRCPKSRLQTDQMVFIVGMPRSGSTLTERILDAHPQVRAIGEHPAMFEVMKRVKTDLNFVEPWPERVRRLSPDALTRLGEEYLAQIDQGIDGASPPILRLIDKALWNTHALGLIAMILPRSRVIWARRDPADSCFSCYAESFEPRLAPYASDLGDLGFVHSEIDRLMRHWQRVLPLPLRLMQYEEMVANQEEASRSVLAFLELPWHDDCLRFYSKASPSATPSYEQVRRPVYDSSIGRAARFQMHLAPLREALAKPDSAASR